MRVQLARLLLVVALVVPLVITLTQTSVRGESFDPICDLVPLPRCKTPIATATRSPDPGPTRIATRTPTRVAGPTRTPTRIVVPIQTPTQVVAPTQTPTLTPAPGQAIIIDHRAIEQFDQIPDSYIRAASQISLLFRHASVGANISDGLDCLMNNFESRPHHCDRDLSDEEIVYDPRYDRSNWLFEFHASPNPNPGWWDKVHYFIDRVDALPPGAFDVLSFKFGYVDGMRNSSIDEKFFHDDPNDNLPSVVEIEALARRHPDSMFLWWTMGLARLSASDTERFNQQMREYAAANEFFLLDIAAIESHRPDGTPCYDNQEQGIEAICEEYTNEVNGGHLNARGKQRLAKAVWVMMARIAGWEGPAGH